MDVDGGFSLFFFLPIKQLTGGQRFFVKATWDMPVLRHLTAGPILSKLPEVAQRFEPSVPQWLVSPRVLIFRRRDRDVDVSRIFSDLDLIVVIQPFVYHTV